MNLVNFCLFICLFSTVQCFYNHIFGHRNKMNYLEFNETTSIFDVSSVEKKWIQQPLDNFNETDNRKWKMRYHQRLDMWKTGGPIYLFISTEFEYDRFILYRGTTYELAKETNGAIFICEHRYYGESKPFYDFTIENLRYLSSQQALADIARLIENLKKRPDFAVSKVVVVGCLYGGNLAAWLRLLYPDLVDAAIASSSPVEAKVDFSEYFEAVGDDYKKYGTPRCYEKLKQMFEEFEIKLQTKNGTKELKEKLHICPENDLTKLENKQLFFDFISWWFYSRAAQFGGVYYIREMCDNIQGNLKIFLNNKKNLSFPDNYCLVCDFDQFMRHLINDRDPWWYQTCTEFGYFHTSSSDNQPFTKNMPIDYWIKYCKGIFGKEFDLKRVEEGVKKTNEMYGGLNLNVSKVVFVNGELDPFHRLSILKDISSEAPAILIPKSPSFSDLYPDSKSDPKELKEARKRIKKLVKKWIGAGEYASPES